MAIDRAPWSALVDDDGSNLTGTIWNKDKIKTVLLDPVDAFVSNGGVWTTYAPTWTGGGGTAPVIGNGTLNGRYMRIGAYVAVLIAMKMESTSTAGTAPYYRWSLPFAPKVIPGLPATNTLSLLGMSMAPGGTTFGPLIGFWQAGLDVIVQAYTGGLVGPSFPFTWAPGASISLSGIYEV